MKILIFSWRGPGHSHEGGAELVIHEHAKAWIRAGHEVTLFTSNDSSLKKNEKIDGIDIIRDGNEVFGVHIKAFVWYLFKKNTDFDLIIDNFHGIPFFTPLYSRTKKIAFIHEVTKDVWKLNPWPKPINLIPYFFGPIFESWIFRFFYKKIIFITVSNSTREELHEFGIPLKNISVIHNGVTILDPKVMYKEKNKTVIFLGAISKDKGIDDAFETFSLLNKKGQFQFWIVGKGNESLIKKKAEDLGLSDLKYWGYVSDQKKFELLKRAHVLLNPSVREGWGLVVIEAAAMGTPTIGYVVAGLKDSVINGKTGILENDKSPESLTKAILNLLSNDSDYQKMSNNAKKWSKSFSWDKSTKKSLKLISAIVAS